ncbi:hypothetical protein [Streptomyces sp. NPDC058398]|uniref:hypothetical protein n=1 Tax=Streptomyces sp. NPDC058398 TaxID=3346479 RepID=UPI003664EB34
MNDQHDPHAHARSVVPPSGGSDPWEFHAVFERMDQKLDVLSGLVPQVNDHEQRISRLEQQQRNRNWGSSLIRAAAILLPIGLDDLDDFRF